MKTTLFSLIFLGIAIVSRGQSGQNLSQVIEQVSIQWKKDSNSCKGFRQTVVQNILNCQIDSLTKEQLFLKLGKPNRVQKFFSGVTKKNYVGYVYDTYKDDCPKTEVDGQAIQFIFEESKNTLSEIEEIIYCG